LPIQRKNSKIEAIYQFIKKTDEASISKINEALELNKNTVRGALIRLRKKGLIKQTGKGKYKVK
jgi:Mn-dependent DtxR family transcriptional regulator